jgi:hypothetical protein
MMARRRPALRGPFCCCGPSRWVHGISRACEILKRLLCVVRRSAPASDRGHQHRDAPDAPLGRLALAIHGVLLRHRRFAIAVAGAAVLAGLVVAIAAPALKGTASRSACRLASASRPLPRPRMLDPPSRPLPRASRSCNRVSPDRSAPSVLFVAAESRASSRSRRRSEASSPLPQARRPGARPSSEVRRAA